MLKKALSALLTAAMLMSVFCAALSTTAAADDIEVPAVTYYLLAPDDSTVPNAYWWTPSEAAGWPGTAMTAATDVGKKVYEVNATAETTWIIFNGSFG